ncbi:MAG: glyoxalase family protein [Marivirga sp.]|jgi:glyoxalase family protein
MNFKGIVKGLHHVTATVNDAQEDYDFYTKLLGLRLVKETVNFDNEKVFHFYYGNEVGTPSTIFTTFPYKGQGVRKGKIGTGQVYRTSLSIPTGSIDFWKNRFKNFDINYTKTILFNQNVLLFDDPSGLHLDLTEVDADDRGAIWETEEISKNEALRGMHHVVLKIADIAPTIEFLQLFGYELIETAGEFSRLEAGEGGAGNSLWLLAAPEEEKGRNGIGTVHHIAHRVANIEDSKKIKSYLEDKLGIEVTEVKDRKYFQSIYFRIPGGVLFEVATEGPGFLVDEENEALGTELKLPDWQEPNRDRIESNLLRYKR